MLVKPPPGPQSGVHRHGWLDRTQGSPPLASHARLCAWRLVPHGGRSCSCRRSDQVRAGSSEAQATTAAADATTSRAPPVAAVQRSYLGRHDDGTLGPGERVDARSPVNPAQTDSPGDSPPAPQPSVPSQDGPAVAAAAAAAAAAGASPSPQPVSVSQWRPSPANPRWDGLIPGNGNSNVSTSRVNVDTSSGKIIRTALAAEPGTSGGGDVDITPPKKNRRARRRELQRQWLLRQEAQAMAADTAATTATTDPWVMSDSEGDLRTSSTSSRTSGSGAEVASADAATGSPSTIGDGSGTSNPEFLDPGSGSRLDRLVARALSFDGEAFRRTAAWGESDWDLGESPGAAAAGAADDTARGSSHSSSGGGSGGGGGDSASDGFVTGGFYGGSSFGRRGRRRSGGAGGRGVGGALLDDEEAWEYGTYMYDSAAVPVQAPSAAEQVAGASQAYLDEGSGGSPGDLRPKRRARRGRGGGAGGWDAGGDDGWAAAATTAAEDGGWARGARSRFDDGLDPDAAEGLEEVDWGLDAGPAGDELWRDGGVGGVGGTAGESRRVAGFNAGFGAVVGGGKKAAIASESRMRRAMAAVSTRLPRIGLSVTFPLPPASASTAAQGASPAEGAVGAAAAPPETAGVAITASVPAATEQAPAMEAVQAIAEAAPAGEAAGAAGAAATSSKTSPAAAAAASGAQHDWATVPLSYNFGPSFKLLEESAVPAPTPLPDELLLCAGVMPPDGDGGGGGAPGRGGRGRRSLASLLPGCTAYTLASEYQILLVQDARSVAPALSWLLSSLDGDRVMGIDAEWPPSFVNGGAKEELALLQLASPSRVVLIHIAQMKRHVVTALGGPLHSLLSDASITWVGCGWTGADRSIVAAAFSPSSPSSSCPVTPSSSPPSSSTFPSSPSGKPCAGKSGTKEAGKAKGSDQSASHPPSPHPPPPSPPSPPPPLPEAVVDVQCAARAAGWHRVGLLGLVTELMGVGGFTKPRKVAMTNWAAAALNERQVRYAALDALLPPLLLRQLRLFAAMPGLRCSFCKHAMHAPVGVQQFQPLPAPRPKGQPRALAPSPPPPPGPCTECDHCGRSFWRLPLSEPGSEPSSASDGDAAAAASNGTDPRVGIGAAAAERAIPPAPASKSSKSQSLRAFLESVVVGRQYQQGQARPQVPMASDGLPRPRRLLFPPDLGLGMDVDLDLDCSQGGGGSGSESDDGEGVCREREQVDGKPRVATQTSAAVTEAGPEGGAEAGTTGKKKRKKKNLAAARALAAAATAGGGADAPAASARQQALWDAFEQSSPAAAAAVAMAMGRADAAGGAGGADESAHP